MPKRNAPGGTQLGKLKRTFYLESGAVLALSEIQTEELRRTGRKPDLSQIVTRAILGLKGRAHRKAPHSDHGS